MTDLKTLNSKLKTQNCLTDFHCHLLPGIDDGPNTIEESVAMARQLAIAGFEEVYCTPHCMKGVWENTPEGVKDAVAELKALLDEEIIPIKLHPGMEYYLDEFFPQFLDNPQTLGDSDLILVESPSSGIADLIKENVYQALRRGLKPLIAHPERNEIFSPGTKRPGVTSRLKALFGKDPSPLTPPPSLLTELRTMGCLFQGNLGSFAGRYGKMVQSRAMQLLEQGFYDHFGSDAHQLSRLDSMLDKGLEITSEKSRLVA